MGLHETKKVLYSKGNHQQNKKTTHRMGEHIYNFIKNLQNLTPEKQLKNGQRTWVEISIQLKNRGHKDDQ